MLNFHVGVSLTAVVESAVQTLGNGSLNQKCHSGIARMRRFSCRRSSRGIHFTIVRRLKDILILNLQTTVHINYVSNDLENLVLRGSHGFHSRSRLFHSDFLIQFHSLLGRSSLKEFLLFLANNDVNTHTHYIYGF